jgi:hypothetical protein
MSSERLSDNEAFVYVAFIAAIVVGLIVWTNKDGCVMDDCAHACRPKPMLRWDSQTRECTCVEAP